MAVLGSFFWQKIIPRRAFIFLFTPWNKGCGPFLCRPVICLAANARRTPFSSLPASMPSDLTKKVVVGCLVVGAAAVAGAALYFRVLRREEAEEDLHFTIPPKVEKPANNAEKPGPAPPVRG